MSGGKGSVVGVFPGTPLIGIISNSLNLLQVPSFWQYVVLGAIIVAAVFISNSGNKKN
jgi:ribose/xylose/arabinose/galactoside ABC-type transport system permease subunit